MSTYLSWNHTTAPNTELIEGGDEEEGKKDLWKGVKEGRREEEEEKITILFPPVE